MKITTFNPMIVTNHFEEITGLFEALGFERRHAPSGTAASGNEYTDCRMKDANGFHVDVATISAPLPQDITSIRMNVDDFDEAYEFLTARGFTPPPGIEVVHSGSARALPMIAPSGFMILLVQHIRKEN